MVPPGPIPNPEVKHWRVDDSGYDRFRESRSLPGLMSAAKHTALRRSLYIDFDNSPLIIVPPSPCGFRVPCSLIDAELIDSHLLFDIRIGGQNFKCKKRLLFRGKWGRMIAELWHDRF